MEVGIHDPARRSVEKPEESGRFRCKKPLKAHEEAPQIAQLAATTGDAMGEEIVLDLIHLDRRAPNDLHQHVCLIVHQVGKKFRR